MTDTLKDILRFYGIFFNIELRNSTSSNTHKKAANANQRYSSWRLLYSFTFNFVFSSLSISSYTSFNFELLVARK